MTTFRRPNPSSGVPVYLQLAEQVKNALETGALRPGDSLPPIGSLAEELVVSPNTVARAYRALEQEGLVALQGGAATILAFSQAVATQSRPPDSWRSARELVLENSQLTSQIAAEVAHRVEQNRELDLAREVQERLLPQACPEIAGLDYAGVCRPARGVGGDYYDFFPLSGTELGLAIGDVSGKGMSAALLMATLRAHLHSQANRRASDLPGMMVDLNRLVYESSTANRYVTFFYAQYDAATRQLEYVNAGHNPPFVVRHAGDRSEIIHLDVSGPVIGLMPDCSYELRKVVLQAGDVLVLFTDGISESMNGAGEEWGEERLTQVIDAHRARPARELIDHVMRTSDAFVDGAAQYDDMTLIAARVLEREGSRLLS